MGIFCFSIIAVMTPSSSAQQFALIRGEQHVTLDYDASSIENEFTPTKAYTIDLNLTYFITALFPNVLEMIFLIDRRQQSI
jgi:hypothetical protein